MIPPAIVRSRWLVIPLLLAGGLAVPPFVFSQQDDFAVSPPAKKLRMSFRSAPWDEVLRWLGDASGMTVAIVDVPPAPLLIRAQKRTRRTRS